MNIVKRGIALDEINEKEFISLYEMTPKEFMEEWKNDWIPDDLNGKYVISVERSYSTSLNKEDPLNRLYCFQIQGIYTPRYDQTATLNYYGHIAFVEVEDKNTNNTIVLLYKDDECCPEEFAEWYEKNFEWQKAQNYNNDGVVPTKQEVIDVIELMIKANVQNPKLELNIKEEDLIILQGL